MFKCCNLVFKPEYSFYVQDKNYLKKRVEFGYCPHCNKAIYREHKTDFKGNNLSKLLTKHEAQKAFNKAMFNRLVFISKIEQGTRSKQHWCYGDFKENISKGGKIIQFQIRRNMNGQEVENFGVSEAVLK